MNEIFQFYQALEEYNRRNGRDHLNRVKGPHADHNYYDHIAIDGVPSGAIYLCYVYFRKKRAFSIELFLENGKNSDLERRIIRQGERIATELFPLNHEPSPRANDCRLRYYSEKYDLQKKRPPGCCYQMAFRAYG